MSSKYSNLLTILLVVIIVAIIVLLSVVGFNYYKNYTIEKDASSFIEQYDREIISEEQNEENQNEVTENEENNDQNQTGSLSELLGDLPSATANNDTGSSSGSSSSSSSSTKKQITYKGYPVLGYITISKINLEYPILDRVTKGSLEVAVGMQYGPGPNEIGNTVILGHNYENGRLFSKLNQLSLGDTIYIKDNSGTKIKYEIYNIYKTTPDDAEYMTRQTDGKREISLATCSDSSKKRLIIWAREVK